MLHHLILSEEDTGDETKSHALGAHENFLACPGFYAKKIPLIRPIPKVLPTSFLSGLRGLFQHRQRPAEIPQRFGAQVRVWTYSQLRVCVRRWAGLSLAA